MLKNIITLGDKITIIQQGKSSDDEMEYESHVLELKGEDELHIELTTELLEGVPVRNDEVYKLCIYTNRGIYLCDGRLSDTYEEEDKKIGIFHLSDSQEKTQRREYYRLVKTMEIRYRLYEQQDPLEESETTLIWNRGILTDISGGGARFYCKEKLEVGSEIYLKLRIRTAKGTQIMELGSNVIHVAPMENKVSQYEIRVEFSKITVNQREDIIRYVFEEERKQLRREKGLM